MAGDTPSFRLGRYTVTGRIASGGMATVYRARLDGDGGFAREFAIKVVHPHLTEIPGFEDRFLDEARVASRVHHPNVVATVDIDSDRGYRFLVLELVDGPTLRQLQLHSNEPLAAAHAALVVCDIAHGLHAVHSAVDDEGRALHVIHRDLSPHNLMLDNTGRAVLIDLGLAKARGQLGHTETGVLCGRLPYMSPEQSRLETLDARSDVFSLGVVLFELSTGILPFGDDHTPGTLAALRLCDPTLLLDKLCEAGAPAWLRAIILTCLQPEAGDRFPTSEALANRIEDALAGESIERGEIRKYLAGLAREVHRSIGAFQPTDPLPARLPTSFATETASVLANKRGGWASSRRLLSAVAASLVLVSAIGWALRPKAPTAPPSLPESSANPIKRSRHELAPPQETTSPDDAVLSSAKRSSDQDEGESQDGQRTRSAPPQNRRNRGRRRRSAPATGLRPNPYGN